MSWGWIGVNSLITLLLFRGLPPYAGPAGRRGLESTLGATVFVTAICTAEVIFFMHRRSSAGLQTVIEFSLGGMWAWLITYLSHRHDGGG